MPANVGDRVMALVSMGAGKAHVLGAGVYSGMEVPPAEVSTMLHSCSIKNPKITLDNGDVVWGCECWWGSEEKMKERISGLEVVEVSVKELRA